MDPQAMGTEGEWEVGTIKFVWKMLGIMVLLEP